MRIEANPRLRELAVDYKIDVNQDQKLSGHEMSSAVNGLLQKASGEYRRAESSMRELEMLRSFRRPFGGGMVVYGRRGGRRGHMVRRDVHADMDYMRMQNLYQDIQSAQLRADRYRSQAAELQGYQQQIGTTPASLMSRDFETRFAALTGEQRNALVDADVRGNADGFLSRDEYTKYNKKSVLGIFGKKRFEGNFGKSAHNRVLNALAAPSQVGISR